MFQLSGRSGSSTIEQSPARRPRMLLLTSSLLLLLLPGGCGTSGDGADRNSGAGGEPRFGFLQVALTDGPLEDQGITAVNICIERVDVLFADDQPRGIIPVSRTINLLDLRDGVTTALGISQFPVGVIHQVRLILCPDGATVVVNGVELPLKVPSGEQTGIKLNSPGGFEIRENLTTTIVIDFDAERSIHYAPGQGWMLTPVVLLVEKAIVLAVTYPPPGAFVPIVVTVRGTVASKEPLLSLTVNGESAVVDGLDWRAEIALEEGPNPIAVEAVDECGRSASIAFVVVVDTIPPQISIVQPVLPQAPWSEIRSRDKGQTQESVAGTVTDDGSGLLDVEVWSPLLATHLASGAFSFALPLRRDTLEMEWWTPVEIRARDRAGNESVVAWHYVVTPRSMPRGAATRRGLPAFASTRED